MPDAVVTALVLVASIMVLVRVGVVGYLVLSHVHFRRYLAHKGAPPPLHGPALLRWFVDEYVALLRVIRAGVFFRLFDGIRFGVSRARGIPVVCVHGYTQNGSNFHALRRRLEAHGRPTCAPSLGLPFRPLEVYAARLAAIIDEVLARHPESEHLDVVAHSMGGLVVRLVFRDRPDLAARARVIVTLGSPHRGSAAARLVIVGRDAAAMRRRSPLFISLPELPALATAARIIAVAARQDYVVYPRETSLVAGAENVVLDRPGHVGLLVGDDALALVEEAVLGASSVATKTVRTAG